MSKFRRNKSGMNNQHPRIGLLLLGSALLPLPSLAQADTWFFHATPSATTGSYQDSLLRDTVTETGLRLSADYLDQGGLTTGFSKTWIGMQDAGTDIEQNNLLLSGRWNVWPDSLPGRVSLRLDGHHITNNDLTGDTDDVSVLAPQISWLSSDETLYADLGYAWSDYQNQLEVHQFTPTLGYGFNAGADWIQVRGYLINGLNPARAAGNTSTQALDTSWTHYFAAQSRLVPASLSLGLGLGERIYAVDMNAQSVANLADINQGSATLGLTWNLARNTQLTLLGGQSRFHNAALNNDYSLNLGYASLSMRW